MRDELESFGHVVRPGASCITLVSPGLEYSEHPPPRSLSDVVACVWSSRVEGVGTHLLRTLPDGCVEIAFTADSPTLVYGPGAAWADVPLEGGRAYRGIRLRPGRAARLGRLDLAELSGCVVPAADVLTSPRFDERTAQRWTESVLAHLARFDGPPVDPVVAEAVQGIAGESRLRLPELARRLAISERQLRRRFVTSVGLAPSTYARVTRMHRAVRAAFRGDSYWGAIAYDAGFADQAHLSREILALTGHTPAQLLPTGTR